MKVARPPSFTLTSFTDHVSVSSSWIVPTPWRSAIVRFVGLDRLTLNVSFASLVVSPLT